MNTTTKVILAIIGVLGVGAIVYFLTKPKEAAKPTINTGSGNTVNLGFPLGGSNTVGAQAPADFGFTGTNAQGEQVVNGMTAAQYLAGGYTQAEVNQIFA